MFVLPRLVCAFPSGSCAGDGGDFTDMDNDAGFTRTAALLGSLIGNILRSVVRRGPALKVN